MLSNVRRNIIWVWPVAGSVVGIVVPGPLSDLILGLVIVPSLVLTVMGTRRLGGLRGWRYIAGAMVLVGFAPVVTEIHWAVADPGPLTMGDAALAVGYGLYIVGVRAVLMARTMAAQHRSRLDAGLTTLWVGFLVLAWAGPRLTARLSGFPLVVSVVYLPLSLIVVYYLLRLVFGSDSRSGSVVLLALTAGLTMISEVGFLAAAAGHGGARRVGVGAATLALVAVAAAVRHPSAPEIESPVAGQQEPLTVARSLWLVLSFVAAGASLAVLPRPPWYLALLLAVIGALTGLNLFSTIRERERLLIVERALRSSLAGVLRADKPDTIIERAGLAADRLLAHKNLVEVDLIRRSGGRWVRCPDEARIEIGADLESELEQARANREVFRVERRSSRPGVGFVTLLAVPLRRGGNYAHLLFVEAAPVLNTAEIEQLRQVTAAVDRALVSYELTEASHRQRADHRFRALVQDSSDVVAVVHAETLEVVMVSPSLHRILGHREDDLEGGSIVDRVHPDDRDDVDLLLRTALVRPQTSPIDVRLDHIDGHYQWFSAMVRDHTDDDEVRGLVLNLTDINRRKLAELSLGFSEQRYRALLLNSRDVFAVLEPDLTVNFISPNVESVLGYPAPDLMAANLANLLTGASACRLRTLLEADELIHDEALELEVRTRDGDIRVAEVIVSDRTDDESGFLLTLSDVTERRELETSLRHQALYDSLTGLAKRSTLYHQLQQMLQRMEPARPVGLLHIDLDELKSIDRTVGFETADELLVQVATRLRSRLRSGDLLARVGSYDLAVAVEAGSVDELLDFARFLHALFDEPFEVGGRTRRLNASIGVAATDDRTVVGGDLLNQASLAAATVAATGGSGIEKFEPSMRSDATTRFELSADLDGAVAADQLHLVYQPILEIESSTVRGVEALLRWNHPDRGPVSPGVFIPLAEQSGRIMEIGRWVVARACDQLGRWDAAVPGAEHLSVSVNVSALQLEEEGEARRLAEIVLDSGLAPSRVTIELTESTLIDDPTWMRAQLETFRNLGMRVAVDDFGTGAAGMGHLRDVPFDVVKIDKSYVDGLQQSDEAKRLVAGVIDLAHTMGARTVAEGIEEPGELELLRGLGCDLGQGFYLGRPMEPSQLEEWFHRGRAGSAPALITADQS